MVEEEFTLLPALSLHPQACQLGVKSTQQNVVIPLGTVSTPKVHQLVVFLAKKKTFTFVSTEKDRRKLYLLGWVLGQEGLRGSQHYLSSVQTSSLGCRL